MNYEDGIALGELIEVLAARLMADRSAMSDFGFVSAHSYRGYYECLAFKPGEHVLVAYMLECARRAVGATFEGYKGGSYTMDCDTECYIAEYGCSGVPLTPALLRAMLEAESWPELARILMEDKGND